MSRSDLSCCLCVHGRFYQPPRADPLTGQISREPIATLYANWNERFTAECCAPDAEAGHFEHIGFNPGSALELGRTGAGILDEGLSQGESASQGVYPGWANRKSSTTRI
jgi:hypothetical protein